jgi:phosphoglycerate dehydrogenase-like enzyme
VEKSLGATFAALDELLAQSDIVTLHLPLMAETAGLIDERRLALMKPGALLVNAARGGLVDEAALHRHLTNGHLFGAAIDAFSQEPPVGNPLLLLDNTVVTPHAAGATLDNFAALARRAVDNTRLFLAGQPLPDHDAVLQPPSATTPSQRR